MRIASFLLLGLFTLEFISCSSDDEDIDPPPQNNPPPQESTIHGEWHVTHFSITDGVFYEETVTIYMDAVADDLAGNDITFHNDGSLSGNNAPFEMEVNSVVDGMPITTTETMSSVMTHEGEWNIEGGILYLQEDGSDTTEEFTIETLTATTLKLTGDQNSITTGDAFPPGSVFDVTLILER